MSLAGKSALVTGSTSGIGLGIARALAAEGAGVTLNGLSDSQTVRAVQDDIERDHGVETRFSRADMTKPDDIAAMIADHAEAFGGLDILVNNAGIQFVSPVEEFPAAKWDAIIAINLSAAFHTIRATVPLMRKAGWGRIINTASAHALVASPDKVAYVAAKHGIAGLTKTVALEVAEDAITVNAIAPGYVWTPLVERQIPDTARARGMTEDEVKKTVILEAQPTKEFVTIDQVAALAVFLTGDAAASITGTVLPVDGGWTAQ